MSNRYEEVDNSNNEVVKGLEYLIEQIKLGNIVLYKKADVYSDEAKIKTVNDIKTLTISFTSKK